MDVAREQVLELLKSSMKIEISYDSQNNRWKRAVDYDTAKAFQSDITKQVFSQEPSSIAFATEIMNRWNITAQEYNDILSEMMFKNEYLNQISFPDEVSKQAYMSYLPDKRKIGCKRKR